MLTRRDFMAECAVAGAAIAAASVSPLPDFRRNAAGASARSCQYTSDQPYLDATGIAVPYLPPAGMRSAAPVAHLS